jgi:hypothetical protein
MLGRPFSIFDPQEVPDRPSLIRNMLGITLSLPFLNRKIFRFDPGQTAVSCVMEFDCDGRDTGICR